MRSLSAAVCFSFIYAVSAIAQQPPATSTPPPAAPQAPAAPAAQAPAAKGNFIECRQMARQNKVAKEQRQKFMRDCLKDIAAECRGKAKQQKLTGEERKVFTRDCIGRPARHSKQS